VHDENDDKVIQKEMFSLFDQLIDSVISFISLFDQLIDSVISFISLFDQLIDSVISFIEERFGAFPCSINAFPLQSCNSQATRGTLTNLEKKSLKKLVE
jgi:hypothetical protein